MKFVFQLFEIQNKFFSEIIEKVKVSIFSLLEYPPIYLRVAHIEGNFPHRVQKNKHCFFAAIVSLVLPSPSTNSNPHFLQL
jgi:hypothetical protein